MISDVIPCLGFFLGTSDSDSFSGAVHASSLLGLRTSPPLIQTKQNLQDVETYSTSSRWTASQPYQVSRPMKIIDKTTVNKILKEVFHPTTLFFKFPITTTEQQVKEGKVKQWSAKEAVYAIRENKNLRRPTRRENKTLILPLSPILP
jgi:hypothetical protein